MPRLPPSLLQRSFKESPFLPALLRECRDLGSCRNELRWLTEHALEQVIQIRRQNETPRIPIALPSRLRSHRPRSRVATRSTSDFTRQQCHGSRSSQPGWRQLLWSYVKRREKGEPLQYIIGTQPFGEVEILCQPGVLIPRPETEVYTSTLGHLARDFLKWFGEKAGEGWNRREPGIQDGHQLRLLDLCTGTGCIPLHLYEMLSGMTRERKGRSDENKPTMRLEVVGIDISPTALDLATKNLNHNISLGNLPSRAAKDISFLRADVLAPKIATTITSRHQPGKGQNTNRFSSVPSFFDHLQPRIDILTANPPYLSPTTFSSPTTARSVRKHEPRLALVPAAHHPNPTPSSPRTPEPKPVRGDEFYHRILPLTTELDVGITVLEVGDTEQAHRVVELIKANADAMADDTYGSGTRTKSQTMLQMWFDDGSVVEVDLHHHHHHATATGGGGRERGRGRRGRESKVAKSHHHQNDPTRPTSARAIVLFRREWARWIRRAK